MEVDLSPSMDKRKLLLFQLSSFQISAVVGPFFQKQTEVEIILASHAFVANLNSKAKSTILY